MGIHTDKRKLRKQILEQQKIKYPELWNKIEELLPSISNAKKEKLADLIRINFEGYVND